MHDFCEYCEHSYDINNESEVRCVYHNKYPHPKECCKDWKERSDELVNRQMAMEATADADSILMAFVAIKHLPAVEPKQEWIPCEERLPSVYQKAVVCNIHGEMMIGTYTEFGWAFPCYFEKPIAWMPLPEPYMKGADDE